MKKNIFFEKTSAPEPIHLMTEVTSILGSIRKSEKTWGRDGQKSLPFLHTFDILEGSGVRHDNKSSNTQCMKIDEEENTCVNYYGY